MRKIIIRWAAVALLGAAVAAVLVAGGRSDTHSPAEAAERTRLETKLRDQYSGSRNPECFDLFVDVHLADWREGEWPDQWHRTRVALRECEGRPNVGAVKWGS